MIHRSFRLISFIAIFTLVFVAFRSPDIFAQKRGKIAILPLTNISKSDISFIKEAAPRLLSSRVASLTGWEVALSDLSDPVEAAAKSGAGYVLTGTVTQIGGSYSIDLVLYDSGGKRIDGFYATASDENAIIASLDGLATKISSSLPGVKAAAPEKVPPVAEPGSASQVPGGVGDVSTAGVKPAMSSPKTEKSFSEIKNIGNLGKFPFEINRVAASDIDGDGMYEVAFMGRKRVVVERFMDGKLIPLKTFKRGNDHHFLNIDSIDLDGDGLEEFVVTDLSSQFLDSFVIGLSGDRIKIKVTGIAYYLSVFEDYQGRKVLVGQATKFTEPYADKAYVLSWDGKTLKKGASIEVPVNESVIQPVLNMNAFTIGGKQHYTLVDQYEKLRVAGSDGKISWKSGDYYSGAIDFIEPEELDPGLLEKTRYYINSRLKKLPGSGEASYLVRETPHSLFGTKVFSYSWSRVLLITWDGSGFSRKVEGEKITNLISDFALVASDEGKFLLICSVIEKEENLLREGMTKISLLELK